MSERWSGYATQSKAWRDGYDWARGEGPHAALDAFDATRAAGYDFGTKEDEQWQRGADFAGNERGNQ